MRVFHGLRLEREGDVAQIDHLILHRYGMIIVESKSVTARIGINEHGEWTRWFNGAAKGMPSPILQAQRQGKLLRDYLQDHRETLLGKMIFGSLQRTFTCMPLDILVAISDMGIIDRPRKLSLPEICKAEQVANRIRGLVEEYRKASGWRGILGNQDLYTFSSEEVNRIAAFLTEHDRSSSHPLATTAGGVGSATGSRATQPSAVSRPQGTPAICRHCRSHRVTVQHGKYGYYLKCLACDGNTAIHLVCEMCGQRERVRKDGIRFYADCPSCKTSALFHTNIVSAGV